MMHGWCVIFLMVASSLVISQVHCEDEVEDLKAIVYGLKDDITNQKTAMKKLAAQTMAQQLFVEERIRSDGHSGIKQTRSQNHGTHAYFESTHINKGAALMHNHCNSRDLMGLGEHIAVLNGVEFRTRHNDFMMKRRSTTDTTYNAVEPIEYPEVPPEVLAKPTVTDQILEMREWMKAFKEQDYSVRDYRKYFRPLLCYLEGAWTLDTEITEPFVSSRHSLAAQNWDQLRLQVQYTSYTGAKDVRENFSFLPTKIISINETTGEPVYAQWNYNILCHPYSGDVPTKYLHIQDDVAFRKTWKNKPLSWVEHMRGARHRISKHTSPSFTGFTLLDKIMMEIPGKDNVPPFLNEEPMGETIYDPSTKDKTKLNTGYYHRMYRTSAGIIYRGFSDSLLFFAETTQERVAPATFRKCENAKTCYDRSTRFSWAIPLELVYLTPLNTWNPYNLTIWGSGHGKAVTAGRRNGGFTTDKAFNGTSLGIYNLTPESLFSSLDPDIIDPADTVQGAVGVLDKEGNVRRTVGSGTTIVLPAIKDVGHVRTRYAVFPVHGEGSTVWKDLQALRMNLLKSNY